MNPSGCESEVPNFPRRMFVVGEEPVGIRVTPYHKPNCISKIIGALEVEEVEFIRSSPFGKLLEIAEKPPFSGRFGRYLISRQLKISKKHEIWFLFAGKPIRFSLREFALVTGLNCRRFPKRVKKRSNKNVINTEKPYWYDLFGTMKEVPVSYVVTLLKKKTVVDRDIRIKYALLALISSVLLPTSHYPRISEEYAEKIKDIDKFMDYPWGRVSFNLLMCSIKERNEVSLTQNTIALKGFVMSIQLVLIEAVPSLFGVVRDGASSDSDGEFVDEDDNHEDDTDDKKKSINTVHVRDIDTACKALVTSVISHGVDQNTDDNELGWSDDEEDEQVDNLVQAIVKGFTFNNSHFIGGATKADVIRMRDEAKKTNATRKTARVSHNQAGSESLDPDYVESVIKRVVSSEMSNISAQMKDLAEAFTNSQNTMRDTLKDALNHFMSEVMCLIPKPATGPNANETQTESQPISSPSRTNQTVVPTNPDAANIIMNAMQFANNATPNAQKDPLFADRAAEELRPVLQKHTECEKDLANKDHHPESSVQEEDNDFACNMDVLVAEMLAEARTPINNQPSTSVDAVATTPVTHVGKSTDGKMFCDGLLFPDPTFSIGLTQLNKASSIQVANVDEQTHDEADNPNDPPAGNRKSKRAKIVPKALVGDYQCDKRVLTRAWEAFVYAVSSSHKVDFTAKFGLLRGKIASSFVIDFGSLTLDSSEMLSLVDRSSILPAKVVDALILHTRSVFLANPDHVQSKQSVFLDTKFVSMFTKSFPKFIKAARKDRFRFQGALCDFVAGDFSADEVTRFYFPFNFDRQHWVGLCVDCSTSQVVVLDCNTSRMSEKMIAEELRPISLMFPYMLRQAGKQLSAKDLKPLNIERPRSVPQNNNNFDAGISSILLIQAHAVGGVEVCKCITPETLDAEVKRTAVMIYEENVEVL